MTRILIGVLALFASLTLSEGSGTAASSFIPSGPVMTVFGPTLPPVGYVQFCRFSPSECRGAWSATDRIELDPESWAELNHVNRLVNRSIEPVADIDLYGVVEHWTYPAGQGDCEDYVLMKRKLLAELGWPERGLLITVVRDELGEGHAVLTVRTGQGDFILDNKRDAVETFERTAYSLVKRQSHQDLRRWVSLVPQDAPAHQVSSWPRH